MSRDFRNRVSQLLTPDSLPRSLALYLSANGLIRAMGLVRGMTLIWLMSQAEFGLMQLAFMLVNLLFPILNLSLHEGVARYIPDFESRNLLWPFLKKALGFAGGLSFISCGLTYLFAEPMGRWLIGSLESLGSSAVDSATDHALLTRVMAVSIFGLVIYHSLVAMLRGLRLFRVLSLLELSFNTAFTLLSILIAFFGGGTGVAQLVLYVVVCMVGALLFAVPVLWSIRESHVIESKSNISGQVIKQLLNYSVWIAGGALCWQLMLSYPVWLLNRRCGQEALATFSGMRVLTQISHLAASAISTAVVSAVTKRWVTKGPKPALEQLDLATKATLVGLLLLNLLIACFKSIMIRMFRDDYHHGQWVLPTLLLFFWLAGAMSLVVIRFNLLQKSRFNFLCSAIGCGTGIILSLWFIRPGDSLQVIQNAGWVSVAAIAAAVASSLFFLFQCQLPPDRGTLILLASSFLLVVPTPYRLAGGLALVLLMISTPLIFNASERQLLWLPIKTWLGDAEGKDSSDNR